MAAGVAYVALLVQVAVRGPLLAADHAALAAAAAHRSSLGTGVAAGISLATDFPAEVVAVLTLALLFTVRAGGATVPWGTAGPRRRLPAPIVLGGAGLLGLLVVPATKELVDRTRPDAGLAPDSVVTELAADAAFPSGHATTSMVFAGLVWLLFAPHLSRTRRRLLGLGALGYAGLVGASRVYLGVHWLTDVLAGWALGAVVVGVLAAVVQTGSAPEPVPAVPGPDRAAPRRRVRRRRR